MTLMQDMVDIGTRARQAASVLASAGAAQKTMGLHQAAAALLHDMPVILKANEKDMARAAENGLSPAMVDRLALDHNRIKAIAASVDLIADLPDPVGQVMAEWQRPNGLTIKRVRTPLGVIGVIYESRPNVTADAGALCLKAGNAVILRGGSDSFYSSQAIHAAFIAGLEKAGLPKYSVQFVETTDRSAVGYLLEGLNGSIDVIVPRGGKSLVARVQSEARVPVFAHLEGICHIYVDRSAKLDMARDVVVNAKMRRTGICGAAETLLIDREALTKFLPILSALKHEGCQIRASLDICTAFPSAVPATNEDWSTEYLDSIISVQTVDGIKGAIKHINQYSSHHTEAVIAEDSTVVDTFFNSIDSAILLHNASTQFADGGEFGFGAEIGIATGKMHARGPIGVEQLTSFQYRVSGNGQIRP